MTSHGLDLPLPLSHTCTPSRTPPLKPDVLYGQPHCCLDSPTAVLFNVIHNFCSAVSNDKREIGQLLLWANVQSAVIYQISKVECNALGKPEARLQCGMEIERDGSYRLWIDWQQRIDRMTKLWTTLWERLKPMQSKSHRLLFCTLINCIFLVVV